MNMLEWMALALLGVVMVLQLLLLVRVAKQPGKEALDALDQLLRNEQTQSIQRLERLERELRADIQNSAQATRIELGTSFSQLQQTLSQTLQQQWSQAASAQTQHFELFGQMLTRMSDQIGQQLATRAESERLQLEALRESFTRQAQDAREEQAAALKRFSEVLNQSVNMLSESNAQRLLEVRQTLESKLRELQTDNAAKLDEMRKTVDEKLHATLEQRLGESFKLVSDRLDKVHQGLGEMQQLAVGVGDLKRVLTNVKSRGTWGEVQLEMLLEQVMTPDQYAKNVETIPGTGARVEFAIRLPGQADSDIPVWLPIDAKFPKEQYERLVEAADRADAEGVNSAGKELERAIRTEAKTIAEKYLAPPHTTDFALLFLPTEGLYAEVMRRPGLSDELQRTLRVSIAGPSTLTALLNSLQMGFRTLALERRSSEVWQILGAVKTEFGKFGEVLASTKQTLERAARNIEQAEVRSRQMSRKLKSVEALPIDATQRLLGVEVTDTGDE